MSSVASGGCSETALAVSQAYAGASAAHSIAVEHTFETAHRLPQLPGKCTNLHGHSWRLTMSVSAPALSAEAVVVEFGALKAGLRRWVDTHLDHGTMLGADDALVHPLLSAGCRVFRFGLQDDAARAEKLADDLPWPTVEAVAVLLWRVSHQVLTDLNASAGTRVERVSVRETQLNTADYGPVVAS